ncbi:hypothetical protein DFAR_310004 [Desulfarculales bacterium]
MKKLPKARVEKRVRGMSGRQARPTSKFKGAKAVAPALKTAAARLPEVRQTREPTSSTSRKALSAEGNRATHSPGPSSQRAAVMPQKSRMGFSR